MSDDEIIWTGNLNGDCRAEWNGLTLHAEEMDKAVWWWAVYDEENNIIDDSDNHYPEKYKKAKAAREAAEFAARKAHEIKNN